MLRLSKMRWPEGDGWSETNIVPQSINQALDDARKLGGILILTSDGHSEIWINPSGTWNEVVMPVPRISNKPHEIVKAVRALNAEGYTPKEIAQRLCMTVDRVNRIRENF